MSQQKVISDSRKHHTMVRLTEAARAALKRLAEYFDEIGVWPVRVNRGRMGLRAATLGTEHGIPCGHRMNGLNPRRIILRR